MNYEHKGVQIIFNVSNAQFSAKPNGKHVSASSLAAVKKQIDAAIALKFEPFAALRWSGDDITPVKVVRVEKSEYRYEKGIVFVYEGEKYNSRSRTLTLDTPENRAAIKKYQAADKAADKEIERIKSNVDKLKQLIPSISADKYGVQS